MSFLCIWPNPVLHRPIVYSPNFMEAAYVSQAIMYSNLKLCQLAQTDMRWYKLIWNMTKYYNLIQSEVKQYKIIQSNMSFWCIWPNPVLHRPIVYSPNFIEMAYASQAIRHSNLKLCQSAWTAMRWYKVVWNMTKYYNVI